MLEYSIVLCLYKIYIKKTLSQQKRFQYPYNYNAKFINKE